jgi:hypothetical protein
MNAGNRDIRVIWCGFSGFQLKVGLESSYRADIRDIEDIYEFGSLHALSPRAKISRGARQSGNSEGEQRGTTVRQQRRRAEGHDSPATSKASRGPRQSGNSEGERRGTTVRQQRRRAEGHDSQDKQNDDILWAAIILEHTFYHNTNSKQQL